MSQYCVVCKEQRLFTKPGITHTLHFVITFFTAGSWAIIWLLLTLDRSRKIGYRCTTCGALSKDPERENYGPFVTNLIKAIIAIILVIIFFFVIMLLLYLGTTPI